MAQILQTGSIAGTVRDAEGQPIAGVQITIVDTLLADVTDANGYFVTTSVLPGTHTVEASLVGYEPVRLTDVVVTQEWTTTVDLRLDRQTVTSLGITEVVAPMIKKGVTPTLYTVTSKDEQLVRSSPNNLYQYPGAAISQPGVVPDSNGFPTIRGGRAYQVGYMLDGINLLQPGSGEFATNLVTVGMDRMNIYTGGYRAELGSFAGGVVNAVVKTGASMRGAATVETGVGDWHYAGLLYEQGDVEANGFNWYVSGIVQRTDFNQNAQFGESPVIADMIVKLIQPLGAKDRLTLLYTGGFQRVNVPEEDPFTGQPWPTSVRHRIEFDDEARAWKTVSPTLDYLTQSHHIGSLTWSHSLSSAANLSAQVYGWNRRKDLNAMSDWNMVDSKTDSNLVAGKLEYAGQIYETLQLRAGSEWLEGDNWDRRVLLAQASTIGAPGARYRIRDADTSDKNAYLAATWKPGDRLTMDLGLRYDSRTYHRNITPEEIELGRTSADPARDIRGSDQKVLAATGMNPSYDAVTPRLGVAYLLSPRTVLKASAGQFAQFASANYLENRFIPLRDATPGGGNPNSFPTGQRKVFDVGPERVDSLDIGFEHQITNSMALAVTPYWRKSKGMVNQGTDYGPDGEALAGTAFTNIGFGHTHGVESKLTLREKRGLSGWLTYTYQEARGNNTVGAASSRPTLNKDEEYRLDYDQKHTVYVVGRYRKGRFEVNPMLELGSGYPWGGQMDLNTGQRRYGISPADGTRLPIFVNGKLESGEPNSYNTGWHDNLSVSFRLYTDKTQTSYYFLQIHNLLNSDDVLARYWQNPVTALNGHGYVPGQVEYVDENGETKTASGHFEYKPWTRVQPIFIAVGVRKAF